MGLPLEPLEQLGRLVRHGDTISIDLSRTPFACSAVHRPHDVLKPAANMWPWKVRL
jgi:hypothetical protein